MSKFVVVIPTCLLATQDIVTTHFKSRASWWHWSPDVWLLRFDREMTAVELRNEMRTLLPGVHCLVMKFENQHSEWAGYGPQEWQNWFDMYWVKKS
jgi:hypothetical protein